MQIVIDIPEEDYILATKEDFSAVYKGNHIAKAIKHGTPLPKGHGRLIDADVLLKYSVLLKYRYKAISLIHIIKELTVLEADKEQESEFKKKARYAMNESGYLDQGITQC